MKPKPSTELDQWVVLQAVVRAGSFAKAAAQLNCSQSSVSYALGKLKERLGIDLLRLDGRRAVLTEAGAQLLAEAAPLIEDFARLEARGRQISAGQEPQIRLHVDAIAPRSLVFEALLKFRQLHAGAEIVLTEFVRRAPSQLDPAGYDLAITFWDNQTPYAHRLCEVETIAVARFDHPVFKLAQPLSESTANTYLRAIIDHQGGSSAHQTRGQHLRVNSIDAAVEAIRSGLCHGRVPKHLIEDDLARGMLKPIPLDRGSRVIPLVLTFADEDMAGPLTREMARLLMETSESYRGVCLSNDT